MKLALFSHCALDTISIEGNSYEQIGGAASYCGIKELTSFLNF